jgi:hypothetical protein
MKLYYANGIGDGLQIEVGTLVKKYKTSGNKKNTFACSVKIGRFTLDYGVNHWWTTEKDAYKDYQKLVKEAIEAKLSDMEIRMKHLREDYSLLNQLNDILEEIK